MKALQEKLDLALKHHQAGKLQKAKALYQKILKLDPDHNDTQHMLGLACHQSGDNIAAIQLYNKALKNYSPIWAMPCMPLRNTKKPLLLFSRLLSSILNLCWLTTILATR